MNYPTSDSKPNYAQLHDDRRDDRNIITSFLVNRYDPYVDPLGPFGSNGTARIDGLTMVEDPVNERNRGHESSPVINKDLMDFIQELKRNNEELRQSNRLLSQKLEQTMDIMREGFKGLQNVLARSGSDSLPRRLLDPDIKPWNVDSESSSIISGVSESPAHEGYVMCFPDRTVTSSDDHFDDAPQSEAEGVHVLSNTSKEKFGFEYDSTLDMNLWLRK